MCVILISDQGNWAKHQKVHPSISSMFTANWQKILFQILPRHIFKRCFVQRSG